MTTMTGTMICSIDIDEMQFEQLAHTLRIYKQVCTRCLSLLGRLAECLEESGNILDPPEEVELPYGIRQIRNPWYRKSEVTCILWMTGNTN
jgi:hypothetical protein